MTIDLKKFALRASAAVAVTVAGVALTGCSLLGNIVGGGGQEPQRDDDGTVTEGTESGDVFAIQVGDCLNDINVEGEVSEVPITPCDEPHDSEVFHEFELPAGDFPGNEAVNTAAEEGCAGDAFTEFVGVPYESSELYVSFYTPLESGWASGDRVVSCTVYDDAGKTTGTLEGSNR